MVSYYFRLGLEAKKEENLSDWFSQVCHAVNVSSVILPLKFTITEKIAFCCYYFWHIIRIGNHMISSAI